MLSIGTVLTKMVDYTDHKNKWFITGYNMIGFHKYNIEQKKPNTMEYLPYDSIFLKYNTGSSETSE